MGETIPDATSTSSRTDYTRVVMETDLGGRRISISALDAKGAGHGHRLSGPKYRDIGATQLADTGTSTADLDTRDADALIEYGIVRYQIALGDGEVPSEVLDDQHAHGSGLARALRWYLRAVDDARRVPLDAPGCALRQQQMRDRRDALAQACVFAAEALRPAAGEDQ